MKYQILTLGLLAAATTVSAQQTATVQMQCHDLSTNGNFVGPDEIVINGMACRPVKQGPAQNHTATPNALTSAAPADAPVSPAPTAAPLAALAAAPLLPATAENLKVTPGAKVYIAPMDGFENYLVAAFGKKKVELVPVFDQSRADYVITGTSVDKKAGWAKIAFMGNIHSDNAASISMTDVRTGAIVYAYAVDKKSTMHGQQTTAEACAKHLKSHMEGHE